MSTNILIKPVSSPVSNSESKSPDPSAELQIEVKAAAHPEFKVMLLNEFFYPDSQGGSGSATSYFARRLAEDFGVTVTTVTSRYAYRDEKVRYSWRDQWLGIDIYRVASPNWGRLKAVKKSEAIKRLIGNLLLTYSIAWKAIRLPKADLTLVVTNPMVLPIAATIVKLVRGTPYAYMIYDLEPDRIVTLGVQSEQSRFVRALRKLQRKWLHEATKVIAIGRCMKDRLVNGYGVDPNNVLIVEIGADPKAVVPMERASAFRAANGIEGFVVLYSGNFGRYHDFDTLLGAAEELQAEHSDVKFVFVGQGYKREYILDQIAKRSLTNVQVYPFVPESEFSDVLASADLCVVTMEQGMEGVCVPGKFYSFLSCGRPVLALMGEESEVARVVKENDIGYRVSVGDVPALVAAVLDGKADSQKLDQMGRRARQCFDELYTADHVTEKMYSALASCLGQKSK